MATTNVVATTPLPKCPGIVRGQRYSTNHAAITIDGQRLNWQDSLALRHHSQTGIEWGFPGSGPMQLALALLLEATDQDTALRYYIRFRDGVIARIATDSWATTTADLAKWLQQRPRPPLAATRRASSRSGTAAAGPDVEPDAQPARRGHRAVDRGSTVPADVARANPFTPPPAGPAPWH